MNPYDAPHPSPDSANDQEALNPPRRFRWFVIPAALSWCFGGVSLLAVPFGTYHTIGMLPIDADASFEERMLTYASITMIPVMLISGSLNIMSGNRWLRGRWIAALLLNMCAYGIMAIPQLMEGVAANQANSLAAVVNSSAKIAEPSDARETSAQSVLNSNFTPRSP